MNIQKEFIPRVSQPVQPKIRFHQANEQTYFSQVYSNEVGDSIQRDQSNATYKENVYYMNYTHRRVTVLKRDGMSTVIERTSNLLKSGFTICRVVTLRGSSLMALLEDLAVVGRSNTMEINALRNAAKNLNRNNFVQELSILFEYHLSEQDIDNFGGTVYQYQMDTVISFKPRCEISGHPYSPDVHMVQDFGQETLYKDQPEFNVKIRLVDHRKNAIPRYMRIAGKVIRLEPQNDTGYQCAIRKGNEVLLENYVQVMYSAKNDTEKTGQSGVESVFYSIEDARLQLGIFDHLSEAQDPERLRIEHTAAVQMAARELELLKSEVLKERLLADQAADRVKMQLLERSQEFEILKHEHSRLNALQKQKQMEFEQQQEELNSLRKAKEEDDKATLKMREMQTAKLEDQYRYRESNLKHQVEMERANMQSGTDTVKWLLGFVTAITSITALYYKNKTS